MEAPLPGDEEARIAALHQYEVLDTAPEQAFDDFARLASYICGTPIALITLVDETRQWFKAKVGLEATETRREHAFCAHVILGPEVMVVPDAREDARFANNALVTDDPHIRFYAGVPLVTPTGHALGTLCVVDRVPHDLTPEQINALEVLSRQVVAQLELRRSRLEQERTLSRLRETEQSLRLLEAAIQQGQEGIMITTAELDEPGPQIVFTNPAFTRISGYGVEELIGQTPRILQGPLTERSVLDRLRANLLRGEPFFGETINYRKDGTPFWMEWNISAVREGDGTITHFAASQRDVTDRHTYQVRLQSQFERITALRAIDVSIVHHRDLPLTLGLILNQALGLLGVDGAAILLINAETQSLEYSVRRGFPTASVLTLRIAGSQEPTEIAAREQRVVTLADLPEAGAEFLKHLNLSGETIADYYAIPLIIRGVVRGVMELFHCAPLHPDDEWRDLLDTLAGQAAIAADNAALFNELERTNRDLIISYDATIAGWSRALDLRDKETEGHSERVTELTVRLAQHMGIKDDALLQIQRGALLHDVGKLGIPDNILLKPGPLTEEEWVIMRLHPTYAYEMLYPIDFLRPALDIPYCHHEKWDGTGYPNELRGDVIPIAARLFAIADVYDALRFDRPYRKGWPEAQVLEHIRGLAGIHFDPALVEVFLIAVTGE